MIDSTRIFHTITVQGIIGNVVGMFPETVILRIMLEAVYNVRSYHFDKKMDLRYVFQRVSKSADISFFEQSLGILYMNQVSCKVVFRDRAVHTQEQQIVGPATLASVTRFPAGVFCKLVCTASNS